jgi:hypothetical protein
MRKLTPDKILVAWANAEFLYEGSELRDEYQRLKRLLCPQIREPALHLEMWRWTGWLLRWAWDAPTEREFAWYLVELETATHRATDKEAEPPKQPIPMEAVFAYFRRNRKTAHHCANRDCAEPYFFARKNQKFCSPICGRQSLLESKRRWWHKQKRKSKPSAIRRKKGKQIA